MRASTRNAVRRPERPRRGSPRGEETLRNTDPIVEHISDGDDLYTLAVCCENGRWLWLVTVLTRSRASAHAGTVLGCGEAPDERDAWKQARTLVRTRRRRATRGRGVSSLRQHGIILVLG